MLIGAIWIANIKEKLEVVLYLDYGQGVPAGIAAHIAVAVPATAVFAAFAVCTRSAVEVGAVGVFVGEGITMEMPNVAPNACPAASVMRQ